jgi:enoyl-CoA hydratase/carnithine racemase
VVLHGEGKAFCAGLDWTAFIAASPEVRERLFSREGSIANLAQKVCWQWQALDVPVIAAVHGAAFGGGLQLALGADIRIVAPDAQLSVMEARYGLVPDMGATCTLRGVVREDIARDLVFTARVVSGEEALALGLATRLHAAPLEAARALAAEIAARSPDAVRAAKRMMRDSLPMGPADRLLLESAQQRTLLGTPNQIEAAMAAMQKRPPTFTE